MKINLIVVGKNRSGWIVDAVGLYLKRILAYCDFEIKYIPDIKDTRNMSVDVHKKKESEKILSSFTDKDYVVVLDENGKEFSSVKFADFIQSKMLNSTKSLSFVIGGAYGFSEEVYVRANAKISLSKMTFSHQIIRLIFVEQLYRAFSIINGEPYHHE